MHRLTVYSRPGASLLIVLAVTACDEQRQLEPSAPRLSATSATHARSREALAADSAGIRYWPEQSDSVLWQRLLATDTTLAIGLKQPGSERGYDRGRLVLRREQWRGAITAVLAGRESAVVVSIDSTHLPVMRLHIPSIQALSRIRRLP